MASPRKECLITLGLAGVLLAATWSWYLLREWQREWSRPDPSKSCVLESIRQIKQAQGD